MCFYTSTVIYINEDVHKCVIRVLLEKLRNIESATLDARILLMNCLDSEKHILLILLPVS